MSNVKVVGSTAIVRALMCVVSLVSCASTGMAQSGVVVTTIAGNGTFGYSGDNGPATSAQLFNPSGIAVDAAGNIYVADQQNNRIRKVTPAGIISTFAGGGRDGGDGGGPATSA